MSLTIACVLQKLHAPFGGVPVPKRALPLRHAPVVLDPIPNPLHNLLRIYPYELCESSVNGLLALGRGPEHEALLTDVRSGGFLLDAPAVGHYEPAIGHEDQEIPVSDRVYDAYIGPVDDMLPKPEPLAVLDGARVERQDDRQGAAFEDLDEVGKGFGVVDVFGAVNRGQGVGVCLEVLVVKDGALSLGDGEVAEAGVLVAAGLLGFGVCSESGDLMWAVRDLV